MARRNYHIRRLKATWPYTVQEIADLLDVHKNAVSRWLRDGLIADRTCRPILIRGDDLVRFLKTRQQSRRAKCGPSQFYCFKCRAPREPYLRLVDVEIQSPTKLRLKALCDTCDTLMNKIQAVSKLPQIRQTFEVQTLAGEHLLERSIRGVNSDLEEHS